MTKLNNHRNKTLSVLSENGFAAFAVTLILSVVLTLIVLGFAANSRDEQTRALDAQLDSAAYYAAESGINDAYNIIKADFTSNTAIPSQTTGCTGPYLDNAADSSGTLTPGATSSSGAVAYTCLLVNPTPPTLEYAPLDTSQGQVVPLFGVSTANPATPVAINTVTISWQESGVTPAFGGCPSNTQDTFSPISSWGGTACNAGVLQVDIVPASDLTSLSNLQTDTESVFLEPQNNYNNPNPQSVVNGSVLRGDCGAGSTGEYGCTVTLNNLPSSIVTDSCLAGGCYYLRILPIYYDDNVSITANTQIAPTQLDLANAQATIDSTGKAGDQLKRIQEYVSINPVGNNTNSVPEYALEGDNGVCKLLTTRPGVTNGSTDTC